MEYLGDRESALGAMEKPRLEAFLNKEKGSTSLLHRNHSALVLPVSDRLRDSLLLYLPCTRGHKPTNVDGLVSAQTLKSSEETGEGSRLFHTLCLKCFPGLFQNQRRQAGANNGNAESKPVLGLLSAHEQGWVGKALGFLAPWRLAARLASGSSGGQM